MDAVTTAAAPTLQLPTQSAARRGRPDPIAARFAEARRLARFDERQCGLYRRLSLLRARLAADAGLPAYQILSNRQLVDLCEAPPADEAALARLQGMNRIKMLAFGAELLATVRLGAEGNAAGS
jgi:ATP-dependent DNA helicase RecQ